MSNSDSSDPIYTPRRTFDNGTLSDRVYESLREDILSNNLPPETPLHEAAIANAFEVSRGPVREALRRLGAEGLVSVIPRRGAVVSSLTPEEFLDAYRVREALEVLAVRLATPQLTKEDLELLENLHEQMIDYADAGDVEGFFAANAAFHALAIDRSGNKTLQEIYHPLITQMRRFYQSSMSLRGGMTRSCEEHERILQAMKDGKADEAARLLSEHIQVPQRMLASDIEADLEPSAQASN
jgi:DNA-binding GntR family transcriptional regulator